MFVRDAVKEEPKSKSLMTGNDTKDKPLLNFSDDTQDSKDPKKIVGKSVAGEFGHSDDSSRKTANRGPDYTTTRRPSEESKVELRMDEITSKFKNAFERMAELESLQLSMERDSETDIKRKWFHDRERGAEFYRSVKARLVPADKETVSGCLTNVGTAPRSVLISAKEERMSPLVAGAPAKIGHVEIENEYESHHNENRVSDLTVDRGFPPEWSYEEQFKKLYDLGDEPDRKEFLDKLFAFMQHRGTPVNRVPIMAKQTLDLYRLFRLVVERGGLVEVINKKIWRGIIKGLNLPSSVTSAAFTLRTQYMKYLYPYECSTLKLSSPSELQSAIDGNRRDTARRPSIGHYTSMVDPEAGFYSNSTSPKSNCSSPTLKRAASPAGAQNVALRLSGQNEFVSPSFHGNNGIGFSPSIQRVIAASSSSDSRALLVKFDGRSKSPTYTNSYEPVYKKQARDDDLEKQMTYPRSSWANIKIRTHGRDLASVNENGEESAQNKKESQSISSGKSPTQLPMAFDQVSDSSMTVSIELNGVKYQGVIYAQHR